MKALRESEERLRMLIESAKDYAIFTTDLGRRVNTWNAGAETLFGYTEQEILGEKADILFTVEDREQGSPEAEARAAQEKGRTVSERWHVRKDGSVFYGSGSLMSIREKSGGGLMGFVKIMRISLTPSGRIRNCRNR